MGIVPTTIVKLMLIFNQYMVCLAIGLDGECFLNDE